MLNLKSCSRVLRHALALSLCSSSALATTPLVSSPEWIYPGQTLPADVGFTPLRAGSGPQAEVKLIDRDWFLLKDVNAPLYSPEASKSIDIRGPVLDEVNAQIYYRLVTGMVLKESLSQLGMSSAEAQRYIEAAKMAGKDFDKASLEEIGPLPTGLDDLYRNFSRPLSKMAVLPYLVLPLSIGHESSQLQHFSQGSISETAPGPGVKMCSTMKSVAPLADVQSRIDAIHQKMDELSLGLRTAKGLHDQSNAELVRLTSKVKDQSGFIEMNMSCFSSIKDRVSRGSEMPTAECLSSAKDVFQKYQMNTQLEMFIANNLTNQKGDFQVLQQAEIRLKKEEASLAAVQQLVQNLQDTKNKVSEEKRSNEEKQAKLVSDKELQLAIEKRLNEEQESLNKEYQNLQEISHKLETGLASKEMSEDQVKGLIAETASRNQRIEAIKKRQPEILQEKSQVQSNLSAILTQTEFLGRAIDTNKLQIQSIETQLGSDKGGLMIQLDSQKKVAQDANEQYLIASKASNFSEYILSILNRNLIEISQTRDSTFALLRKEEELLAKYKAQIIDATKNKDAVWSKLESDLAAENSVIAAYRDPKEMGFFLETDCESRTKFDSDATGIYLSRAPIAASNNAVGTRADAGKWGMFSMPYNQFQNSIQNGVLLNMQSYIQLSVQKMFENYDYSVGQYMNPSLPQCAQISTASVGAGSSILGLMKSAFDIWNSGSDEAAKATAYCQNATADQTSYPVSLAQMIDFNSSVLDQTLPKRYQSRSEDLIERDAVEALAAEIAVLTGSKTTLPVASQSVEVRRDNMIKALIKVLAFDYREAAEKSREVNPVASKYKFATPAPGASMASTQSMNLTVGAEQEIKALDGVVLYSAPINRMEYETAQVLSLGDKVRILSIDEKSPNKALQSGWVKVQSLTQGNQEAQYMPAWALSAEAAVDDNGRAVYDISDDSKCPVRRIVKSITNFNAADKVITRMLPNLKTGPFKNGMYQILRTNQKTTPAATDKMYIACELFSVDGQRASPTKKYKFSDESGVDYSKVQGIRIVEVKMVQTRSGQTRYVPTEDYGGFVHTWLPGKSVQKARIELGGSINPKTWSLE